MTTASVSATSNTSGSQATGSLKQLDRDAFLKLLITELENQDPLQPMEDKDFIAQLAQFSSLEQMQSLNQGFTALDQSESAAQAFAMIGRRIDYADPSDGTTHTGTVGSVSFVDGEAKLNVGSNSVEVANVVTVY